MNSYQIFSLFILLANCLGVYSFKCRTGFAISQPGSKELRQSFDNKHPQDNCPGIGTNPANELRGCYKNVYELSGGNLYAEYGCFTPGNKPVLGDENNFGKHIYSYVCLTENCNRSKKLKFNLTIFFILVLLTLNFVF